MCLYCENKRTRVRASGRRVSAFFYFESYIYRFKLPFLTIFFPSTVFKNTKRTRRPGMSQSVWMKPRGLEHGPKRTPASIGDAWQNHTSYEVEEVCLFSSAIPSILLATLRDMMMLAYTDSLALND